MAEDKWLSMIEQDDVIERICQGQRLEEIAALYRIKLSNFKRLARKDTLFYERFLEAQKTQVFTNLERIPEIIDRESHFKAKLYAEHARFMAAKLDRETFGEKIEMNIHNKLDLSDILIQGQERVARIPEAYRATEIAEIVELPTIEDRVKERFG